MEQLPPKPQLSMSMSMSHHNWSSFPFQMNTTTTTAAQNSWVDDFLDFSATRRNAHRRTISDPIAFVEDQSPSQNNHNLHGFERLDDEQLRNMFSDDVTAPNPSTPSTDDDNKLSSPLPVSNLQPKNEPGELTTDSHPQQTKSSENDSGGDTIFDPKRIKRILANRQSAQRSRVRKLQYISELERSVTTLQTEVSALSPRVAFLDHQRLLLNVDNSAIKQRIAALAQDKIFKDAHQEALKKEIERLRKIYHEQSMKKMADNGDQ